MNVRFEMLAPQQLIGMRRRMSLAKDQTFALWSGFMPRRNEIRHTTSTDLVSMRIYDANHDFKHFNPEAEFDKWAGVVVHDFNSVPEGMQTFTIPEGLYAVFTYKGSPKNTAVPFGYIFGTWLPASGYELDTRPQFEILGEKYKNDSEDSEEDIWIPVRKI